MTGAARTDQDSVYRPSPVRRILPLFLLALSCSGPSQPPPGSFDEPPSTTPEVREIRLDTVPTDYAAPAVLEKPPPSTHDLVLRILAVKDSSFAKGLFLRIGDFSGAFGRATDIALALAEVRRAGKPVHCHFEVTDNVGFALLASSCDRLSMEPGGSLDLVGVAMHLFYARSLLETAGVQADLLQMGRYKGAADPFTRDDMPEEVRQTMNALLDDLQADLVRRIAEGRHLEPARVQELIDAGPYDARDALAAHLIDGAEFDDQAREHARQAAGVPRVRRIEITPRPPEVGLSELLDALAGNVQTLTPTGDRIAIAYLSGTITDAEEPGMDESGRSGPFISAMRRFADDDEIKAVVLRIDSPGGSALASDRMWHAVRRVVAHKPVIVSIGDMAASGGYYIASAGTRVLAHDTSLVGSIGVVGGKVVFGQLADRLGVHVVSLTRGRNAGYTSPTQPFTETERAVVARQMWATYDRFLRRIMEGRNLTRERVQAVAEGRIMSGQDAREAGLVDAQGGLIDAIALAREQGHVGDETPIEMWPSQKTLLDAIAEATGGGGPAERSSGPVFDASSDALIMRATRESGVLGRALMLPLLLREERAIAMLPFGLSIE